MSLAVDDIKDIGTFCCSTKVESSLLQIDAALC